MLEDIIAKTTITLLHYSESRIEIKENVTLDECQLEDDVTTWIHVQGLQDIKIIQAIAEKFHIHALVEEDILNIGQRPKIDDFETYSFVTLRSLQWVDERKGIATEQLAIIVSDKFILTFQDSPSKKIDKLRMRYQNVSNTQILKQGTDYLLYRLIDVTIDDYFTSLEKLGDKIEAMEDRILAEPTAQNAKVIYELKSEILIFRKMIWPLREVLSHLLYGENTLIKSGTRIYLRDAYDHIAQAIDTVETFRDMVASLLDMYLSGLSIRMNEIVKTLTIITTIFIPITAIASIYGMNIRGIPLMKSHFGFDEVSLVMILCVIVMIIFFRRRKWL